MDWSDKRNWESTTPLASIPRKMNKFTPPPPQPRKKKLVWGIFGTYLVVSVRAKSWWIFACKLPLINKCELSIQAMSGNELGNRWTVNQITTLWDTCGLKLANCDKTTCFTGFCLTWTTNSWVIGKGLPIRETKDYSYGQQSTVFTYVVG